MRLTEYEITSIVESFRTHFQTGDIFLFGSRTDDTKKGGDIDLFIITQDTDNLFEKKINLLVDIKTKIGDQKIDIVISKDKKRAIEQEAQQKGIKLSIEKIKQDKILNECDKHLKRLKFAKNKLKEIFPLTKNSYQNLTEEDIQAIDQFLYRFSKLQDTIGEKLIKIVFSFYEENTEKFTFIDILNRLEKIEILEVKQWRELRDIRNELAHNYDDDSEESSIIINKVFEKEEILELIYENIKTKIYINEEL